MSYPRVEVDESKTGYTVVVARVRPGGILRELHACITGKDRTARAEVRITVERLRGELAGAAA